MSARIKEINLLPKEKWEVGITGKLLKWALNTGRYVVIFTELVVISAFLYRFGLDRKLTDINASIKQKTAIVDSYGDLENSFRRLQTKLTTIKEVGENNLDVDFVLTNLSQITPEETTYSTIDITDKSVSLQGQTLSETGLATLLFKAQESQVFSGVSLDNVSSATDKTQAINFRLVLAVEPQKI